MTENDSPQPKFRRRAEARPDEVLDAAQALFSSNGYDATSVSAIAKQAGISKGAVYLYFPSKQAILEALVERAVGEIPAEMIAMAAHHRGSVRETITFLLTQVARRLSHPDALAVPKLVVREALTAPDIARMYRQNVMDRAMPAMIALLREGIERGELRPIDPEMALRSLIGPVVVHLILAEVFDIRPAAPGEEGIARLIDTHLTILFDGLAADKGDEE